MFRKCLLVLVLCLGGCFSVGDFGAYWNQSRVDSTLAGRWQEVTASQKNAKEKHILFKSRDGAYDVDAFENGVRPDDYTSPYPVRSLKLGPYDFLLSRPHGAGGDMVRYKLDGNELLFYALDGKAAKALLKPPNPNLEPGEYSTDIKILDAATAQWLAQLPDDAATWRVLTTYRRVR